MKRPTNADYRQAASRCYANDDLEIDEKAKVSHMSEHKGGDPGAWVHAWVWVRQEDL